MSRGSGFARISVADGIEPSASAVADDPVGQADQTASWCDRGSPALDKGPDCTWRR